MHRACIARDLAAVRTLLDGGADVNERDDSGNTPLMLAACTGEFEICMTLIDANADVHAQNGGGETAMSLAKDRGFGGELAGLLGGVPPSSELPLVPDFSSDEEAEAELAPPALVVDLIVSLDTTLAGFGWDRFESSLAALAGVEAGDVFVTPEPGSKSIDAHATVITRTRRSHRPGGDETSARIDEIMKVVKALRAKERLQQAAGGARVLAPPQLTLIGEGADASDAISEHVNALSSLRQAYVDLKAEYAAATQPAALGLTASKAILLLRPGREALAKAAAASKAAAEHARKRQGGGSGTMLPRGAASTVTRHATRPSAATVSTKARAGLPAAASAVNRGPAAATKSKR